jgi:predicted Holliday junction resolvase-like endonuclease
MLEIILNLIFLVSYIIIVILIIKLFFSFRSYKNRVEEDRRRIQNTWNPEREEKDRIEIENYWKKVEQNRIDRNRI